MASQLRVSLIKKMDIESKRVVHLIDSMIFNAQIQRGSYKFKPFVSTRAGEIQESRKSSEWCCIPSDQNPARFTTEITKASELREDSM